MLLSLHLFLHVSYLGEKLIMIYHIQAIYYYSDYWSPHDYSWHMQRWIIWYIYSLAIMGVDIDFAIKDINMYFSQTTKGIRMR